MNNINSLEKASKLLNKIQDLDKKIIAIEKLAIKIANDPVKIKVDFNLANKRIKEENDSKVSFDEDGSIIYGEQPRFMSIHDMMIANMRRFGEEKNEATETFSFSINDFVGLEVLGVVLNDLQKERNQLIHKIKGLGFKI